MGRDGRAQLALALAFCVLFGVILVRTAYLCDDAYITFRVLDHFVSGEGLRFNVAERVQAFTNPLWLFALAPFYALTGEIYGTSLAVSILCSLAAFWIVTSRLAPSPLAVVFCGSCLILSKAFVDWSTSGLENPLTHLLLTSLLLVGSRRDSVDLRTFFFLAGLLLVNRNDLVVILLPLAVAVLVRSDMRPVTALRPIVLGLTPFVAWEIFSLVYYGFPFPNTAYAKAFATGVPLLERMRQGLDYLYFQWRIDPLTPLLLVAALGLSFRREEQGLRPIAAAIVLQIGYILWTGGDQMGGRFLAVPLLLSVVGLGRSGLFSTTRAGSVPWKPATAGGLAVLAWILSPLSPIRSDATYGIEAEDPTMRSRYYRSGVKDFRAHWFPRTGLIAPDRRVNRPHRRDDVVLHSTEGFAILGAIGQNGFRGGPGLHVIDVYGLADPLLSRLPSWSEAAWAPSHIRRRLPDGYVETLVTGRNCIVDPEISRYFDSIRRITRGSVWSIARLAAIVRVNLGLDAPPTVDRASGQAPWTWAGAIPTGVSWRGTPIGRDWIELTVPPTACARREERSDAV